MTARFPQLPPQGDDPRRVATIVNLAMRGKINATAALTLMANAASTTLADERINAGSAVLLSPITANAAAALGTTFVSARGNGSATISHVNNAQTDRHFTVAIIG